MRLFLARGTDEVAELRFTLRRARVRSPENSNPLAFAAEIALG